MKPRFTRARMGVFAVATVVVSSSLQAANYVWQIAGTTNAWSTAAGDTNWFVEGAAPLVPWADGNDASLADAAGETIALTGTVAPSSTSVTNNGTWVLNGTGVLAGSGTLTKNGTGTLTLSNTTANTFSGGTTINGGTLALGTGGTGANTSTVQALGTGLVTVNTGATLKLWIQNTNAFTYTNNLSVNGGTIQSEDGIHTLSGTVALGAGGATLRSKWTGKNLILTGVISGESPVTIARSADGGGSADSSVVLTGSNTFSGGTTVNSAVLRLGNAIATDKGGTGVLRGTLTVNSPGALSLDFTNALGYSAGAKVDTLNINGATVSHTANGDNGWGITYNMTGGLLQSTGTGRFTFGNNSSVNTLANPTSAVINGFVRLRDGNTGNIVNFTTADGGAFNDLTVGAVIEQGAAGYGIAKFGTGTMKLNGANTYTGTTTINAGTLSLGSTGALPGSPVVVNSGASFRVEAPGKTLAAVTATANTELSFVAAPGVTTTVTGALDLSGTISVSPLLGSAAAGTTYDLVTAGSITGTGTPIASFNSAFGQSRATGTVAVNGNKLQLTLNTAGAPLVWNNASAAGAATGSWDTNTTANFSNGGTNDVFKAFDAVFFNDSVAPAAAKTVNVAGMVAPSLINVSNSAGNNYTLTAATAAGGLIAGNTNIEKTGEGSLILGSNLSYLSDGGTFTLTGGTFDLGAKILPAQSKLILFGGTLANGTLPVFGTFDLQSGISSAVLSGPGAITKTFAGVVVLSANNTVSGPGTVSGGTLQIGAAAASGSLGTSAVTVASGATLAFNRNDSGLTIANALSGTGTIAFTGTNNGDAGAGIGNGQSSYVVSGNNSGFSGNITVTNSRLILDNATDTGTATITVGANAGLLVTAGTIPNAITLSGTGWGEAAGLLGALRLQAGTVSGPITLAGNTRITSHSGTGASFISGSIGETGGPRNLEIGGSGTATNFTSLLTLSGSSTYTGTTSIGTTTARLADVTLSGSLGNTAVTVNPDSTLRGNGSIAGSLTFANGSNLGVNAALSGNLSVAGALTVPTTVNVTVTNPDAAPGSSIPLVAYGSTTATAANFVLTNAAQFRAPSISVSDGLVSIALGNKTLSWTGTGGLVWDIGTTANWADSTPAASTFFQGDVVSFTDAAGAANAAVVLNSAVMPNSVTVNNSTTVPYVFTGTGNLGGGGALVKSGTGTLNLGLATSYTGGTTVNGGVLEVDGSQVVNRLPAASQVTVNSGGTLTIRGVNALPNNSNSINVTLNGGHLNVVSGTSVSTPAATQSHAHLGNITLNGGTVDLTSAGSGTSYNGESFQLNGTITVGGAQASTIQTTEAAALQGVALNANRTFNVPDVTGNSDPDLVISAEVENSDANNGAFTKTGNGTLLLAAANTYSAGTTVSAGILILGNGASGSATGTGAVQVAAGTTLGGDGAATGAVTIAGTLAPGGVASPTGSIGLGATTLTGTYLCDIDSSGHDEIKVTGNLTITGSTLTLTIPNGGATETSYRLATWTGTRTGSFNVTGLPAGYRLVHDDFNKEVRIEQGSNQPYQDYETANNIVGAGGAADSDGDGIANGLEFVLGGVSDPSLKINSAELLPTIQDLGANIRFSFHLTNDAAAISPPIWSVEFDDDLTGSWTTVVSPTNGTIVVTPAGDSFESGKPWSQVDVTIPKAVAKRFVRLKVTTP